MRTAYGNGDRFTRWCGRSISLALLLVALPGATASAADTPEVLRSSVVDRVAGLDGNSARPGEGAGLTDDLKSAAWVVSEASGLQRIAGSAGPLRTVSVGEGCYVQAISLPLLLARCHTTPGGEYWLFDTDSGERTEVRGLRFMDRLFAMGTNWVGGVNCLHHCYEMYLNFKTGQYVFGDESQSEFPIAVRDLDDPDLRPLYTFPRKFDDYIRVAPYSLTLSGQDELRRPLILRRGPRARTLSRCLRNCRGIRLTSRYATWHENGALFAHNLRTKRTYRVARPAAARDGRVTRTALLEDAVLSAVRLDSGGYVVLRAALP